MDDQAVDGRLMFTDDQIQAALDYLRDSSEEAAVARAQAKTLEKYLGVIEAEQKAIWQDMSNAAKQDEARRSPEYKQALKGWEEAIKRDCKYQMLREAASSRLDAWRTWQATNRAMEKIG